MDQLSQGRDRLSDFDQGRLVGKAEMIRIYQEMPRLVEEALKDFEMQRLGQKEGSE